MAVNCAAVVVATPISIAGGSAAWARLLAEKARRRAWPWPSARLVAT